MPGKGWTRELTKAKFIPGYPFADNTKPDRRYLHLLHDVTFRPVFIIGQHRSGTTILHKLLAATGTFNFVRCYHITNYDEVLHNHFHGLTEMAKKKLAARMVELGVKDRNFDRIRVQPDLPEEYSFILKRYASILYLPRTDPSNRQMLVELCRKVQLVAEADRPLLLKNPWDSANFLYLRHVFPQARFIFIHRHPLPGVNSRLKAMRSILEERADYSALLDSAYARLHDRPVIARVARFLFSSLGGLDVRLVTRMTKQSANYYLRNIRNLEPAAYTEITYEQLCRWPDETICGMLDFLNLAPRAPVDFSAEIRRRPLRLLPTIAAHQSYIQRQLRHYMSRVNYDPIH